jgi:hypothetical protein
MLRTGQLRCAPPRRRDLARRRGPHYRGPRHLPEPDSHRLAAVSLSLGYTLVPPFVTPAPELLDAHSDGITGVSQSCGMPSPTRASGWARLNDSWFPHASSEIREAQLLFSRRNYPLGLVAARSFSAATTTYQHTLKVSPSGTSPRRNWAATWTRLRYCRSTWLNRSTSAWIQPLL